MTVNLRELWSNPSAKSDRPKSARFGIGMNPSRTLKSEWDYPDFGKYVEFAFFDISQATAQAASNR